MNAVTITEVTVPSRMPFHGVFQIARLNWPFYAAAITCGAAGGLMLASVPMPQIMRLVFALGIVAAGYLVLASLAASYWVYDRSELTSLGWLPKLLGRMPARWANLHAGLDEFTPRLRDVLGGDGIVLDFHDPARMTEPSIARAKRLYDRPAPTTPVPFDALPLASRTLDAAFVLLAAHELRRPADRVTFLRELHRVLAPGGALALAEHPRDLANAVAFGPGVLHFFTRRSWIRLAREAGFGLETERHITPFVRVFAFRRMP